MDSTDILDVGTFVHVLIADMSNKTIITLLFSYFVDWLR